MADNIEGTTFVVQFRNTGEGPSPTEVVYEECGHIHRDFLNAVKLCAQCFEAPDMDVRIEKRIDGRPWDAFDSHRWNVDGQPIDKEGFLLC